MGFENVGLVSAAGAGLDLNPSRWGTGRLVQLRIRASKIETDLGGQALSDLSSPTLDHLLDALSRAPFTYSDPRLALAQVLPHQPLGGGLLRRAPLLRQFCLPRLLFRFFRL